MSEHEIRRLLRELCRELDAKVVSPGRRLIVPVAVGAGLSLSGCCLARQDNADASPRADAAAESIEEEAGDDDETAGEEPEDDEAQNGDEEKDHVRPKRPEPEPVPLYGVPF